MMQKAKSIKLLKMKARIITISYSLVCGTVILLSVLLGCAGMDRRGESVEITKPDISYVSPNFDFNSIAGLSVFPIFPSEIENPVFGDAFSNALTAELQQRQSQWKIIATHDLVRQINQKDLGRGYKNLQADMNTFAGGTGFGALTEQTRKFLKDLNTVTATNSYLLGVYGINRQTVSQRGPFNTTIRSTITTCKVKLVLYQLDKGIVWDATHTVQTRDNIENNAAVLAKVFAAYLGKGMLRNL